MRGWQDWSLNRCVAVTYLRLPSAACPHRSQKRVPAARQISVAHPVPSFTEHKSVHPGLYPHDTGSSRYSLDVPVSLIEHGISLPISSFKTLGTTSPSLTRKDDSPTHSGMYPTTGIIAPATSYIVDTERK